MRETYILLSERAYPKEPHPKSELWIVHVFQELTFQYDRNLVMFYNRTYARNIAIYTTAEGGLTLRNFEAHGLKVYPNDGAFSAIVLLVWLY